MNIQEFSQSKGFHRALYIIGAIVILLGVFVLGVFVGHEKARFSYGWGEHFEQNFGGGRRGMMRQFDGGNLMNAHGVTGQIESVSGSEVTMKGMDGTEKIIVIAGETSIRNMTGELKVTDLKVGDRIVVLGGPNGAGQIQAKLIRVMPAAIANPVPATTKK